MFYTYLKRWFDRFFSNEETFYLFLTLTLSATAIYFFSGIVAPVLVAWLLCVILVAPINRLIARGMPSFAATTLVVCLFLGGFIASLLYIIPLAAKELADFVVAVPTMVTKLQNWGEHMQSQLPFVPEGAIDTATSQLQSWLLTFTQNNLQNSLSTITSLASSAVYLIIVPVLVVFMIYDRATLLRQISKIFPKKNTLLNKVYGDMKDIVTIYMVNKFIEVVIVSIAIAFVLWLFGLNFWLLMGLLTGIAVIIPYVGTAIAFIPIVFIGYAQWGTEPIFLYCIVVYFIVQIIDAYVLVPYLFSDAMNLRPFWILFALIFFGGIWGIMGVILAIPLATFVKIIIQSWPVAEHSERLSTET